MATYRELLNRVKTALSEDEIPSSQSELTSNYDKLLGLFVNQIKEEVEDAHNWRALRSTESVTVAADTSSIAITNANERSRVYRQFDDYFGVERALVFDVTDPNAPFALKEMDMPELLRRRALDTSNNREPIYFAVDNTSAGNMALEVYPTPSVERDITITMIIPQLPLANDDLDVEIEVPARPIEMGVIWYALEERGEELGVNGLFSAERFDGVLGEAIARDAAEQGGYQLVPT